MKKIVLGIMIVIMAIGLTGCAKKDVDDSTGDVVANVTPEESDLTDVLKSIYDTVVDNGTYTGTYEEWIEQIKGPQGEAGETAEFSVFDGAIQWQYKDDLDWVELVQLADLVGPIGANGKEVLFQVADGSIQWQYDGDEAWLNLVTLSTLTGQTGENGKEVLFQVANNSIQWQYDGDEAWVDLVELSTLVGSEGVSGKEIAFQINVGYIQWQYIGDETWSNLVELSTLVGQDGVDGKEVLFQVDTGYIQWQYAGDTIWSNLIEISTLVGEEGIGISSMEINELGQLIVTYTNESVVNLGQIYVVYNVVFRGLDDEIIDIQSLIYGEDATTPENIEVDGYTFIEWDTVFNNVTTNLTVTAVYEINHYDVTFDSNGGTNCDVILDVPYLDSITLPIPTLEGFEFKGWYYGDTVNDGQFVNTDGVTNDLTLYAKWEDATFVLTFLTRYDYLYELEVVNLGEDSTTLPPFIRGYNFIQWDQPVENIVKDMVLRPEYEIATYSITYELDGGQNHIDNPDTYTVQDYITFEAPTKEGYTFLGWVETSWGYTSPITYLYSTVDNRTITATWEVNTYSVNYSVYDYGADYTGGILEYGDTLVKAQYFSHNSIYMTSGNKIFTRGSNYKGELGNGTNEGSNELQDITSFFNLEDGEYIVEVTGYGSSFIALTSSNRVFTWGWNYNGQLGDPEYSSVNTPLDITENLGLGVDEDIIEIKVGTSNVFILTDLNRLIVFGANYSNSLTIEGGDNVTTPTDITANLNLSAEETIDTLFTGYNANAIITSTGRILTWGENTYGQLGDLSVIDRRTPVDITSNLSLSADETIVSIVINRYNTLFLTSEGRLIGVGSNNTINMASQPETLVSAPVDFTSQLNLNAGETISQLTTAGTYSFVLTTDNRVISWGSNSNEQLVGNCQSAYCFPGDITDNFNLEEDEYFISISIQSNSQIFVTSDNRTIVWGYNYGDKLINGLDDKIIVPVLMQYVSFLQEVATVEYDFDALIGDYVPTRPGFTFGAWYMDKELTIEANVTNQPSSTVEFYGMWIPIDYGITYHMVDGINNPLNPDLYSSGDEDFVLNDASKDLYDFDGWYLNPELSGEAITQIDSGSYGDLHLYPKWVLAKYTINYMIENGENNIDNPTFYVNDGSIYTLYDPTRTAYTFIAWYDNAELSGDPITEFTATGIGEVSIYAKWEPIVYTITYEYGSATLSGTIPTTYTIESSRLYLGSASYEMFSRFEGWYLQAEFIDLVPYIEAGSYGNITLYAKIVSTLPF